MDGLQSGAIKPGHKILFSTVASGLVVGSASYTVGPPPAAGPALDRRDHRAVERAGSMRIEALDSAEAGPRQASDTVALARAAAERCLRRSRHKRHEITELTFTGLFRSRLLTEPAVAALLAGELRLNDVAVKDPRTCAYDIVGGGPRFLTACRLAQQRMVAGADVAMVVAAEVEVNAGHPTASPLGVPQFGSAAILEWTEEPSVGFRRFLFRDFVEFQRVSTTVGRMAGGPAYLESERSGEWHRVYAECASAPIQELLQSEGVSIDEIKSILTATASPAYDTALAAALAIEPERVCSARPSVEIDPHPTGSILHAILAAQRAGRIEHGDLCVLVEAGAGVQIGCALYQL